MNIDLLKRAVTEIVDTIQVVEKETKDGLQFRDAIPIVLEAKDLWFIIPNFQEIKAELSDVDSDEFIELVNHVAEELELENEKAKETIEKVAELLVAAYNLIKIIKK